MQQAFGAKVTTLKFENKFATYAVFLKKQQIEIKEYHYLTI